MRRRSFLSILPSSLVAAGFLPARAHGATRADPLHLHDCTIAGSHHYDCHAVLVHLRVGDSLALRREPANRHDARAVEVWWRRRKLGYLPRNDNAVAASLLDRGHALHAEVTGIDDPDEEWEPVRLRVWLDLRGDPT